MTQQTSTAPVKVIRAGAISASVWQDEVEKNGVTVVRHSVRVQKRFQQDNGEWKNTDYFFPEDLPKLKLVAAKAFEFVSLKENEGVAGASPATQ
jgi:hypothetical protein